MARQATPDLLGEAIPSDDPSLETMLGSAQRIATMLIRLDGGTQPRAGIDQAMVDDYANDMANGSVFPPIELVYDGKDYWLWDGFHRFHAYRRDGDRAIPANVRQGTRRDAVLLSVGANATHGLRRTNADKRRSVLALLEDEEWRQWSDREIARRCAVGNKMVSDMRQEILSVSGTQIDERRVIRNGTEYTMHTATVGAAPAVASQEATWLTADEVLVQLDQWSDQFEEPDQALARLHDEASEGTGNTLDDWTNWATGKWSLSRLLQALAALRFLPDEDEDEKPKTKLWEPPNTAKWVEPEPKIQPVSSEIPVLLEPWTKEREIGSVTIWKADSRNLTGDTSIPPVDLVITSPPYNVGIEYSEHFDKLQQDRYIDLLHNVFLSCHKVMRHGARIAVVVPFGIGRNPWQPMSLFVAQQMQHAGFQLRGQIIWDKGTTGNRTSWGSFRSPSDPSLRDTCECIIVAHKSQSQAAVPHLLKDEKGSYTAWLERSEYFMELAQDHWQVAPESAQRVGHPAPFPVELVRRLVHFYGWPGCTLLDPFAGSGTVGVAAVGLDCKAYLVDIDEAYCRLAERRVKAAYQGRNMLEETHAK